MTRLLTSDQHLCVQVSLLSRDQVVGGASVLSGVSGRQVVHQEDQRVGELPRYALLPAQCGATGTSIFHAGHTLPWQRGVEVLIGGAGEMEVSTLSGLLPQAHAKTSWHIWKETEMGRTDVGGDVNKYKPPLMFDTEPSLFLDMRPRFLSADWNQELPLDRSSVF